MKIADHEVLFSTGRKLYAHNGIIGLSPELSLSEGSDGGFATYGDELTDAEYIELADYMIGQWVRFREQYALGETSPRERH